MAPDDSLKIDPQNLEDLLALTPAQEGILFHYLNNATQGYYNQQLCLRLSGNIHGETLRKAWDFVVDSNEALRTVFRWEKLAHPAQIVLKRFQLPFTEYDFSKASPGEKEQRLQEFQEKDRLSGFDIRVHPLRITLCKLDHSSYEMIVSWYHIIFDGWSNGIILKELFLAYDAFERGIEPIRSVKSKYKEFIKWLKSRNQGLQKEFWQAYLAGFEEKTALPLDNLQRPDSARAHARNSMKNLVITLPASETKTISDFCRENDTTAAVFFDSVWGILLQKYNQSGEALFGTTVSGRPATIKSVALMVGLFINTIPLRIIARGNESFISLLKRVDRDLQQRTEYENTPLVDIGSYGGFKSPEDMFDSIVVFENYPLDDYSKNGEGIKVNSFRMWETTHYALTLGITNVGNFELDFAYDNDKLKPDTVARIAGHFREVLKQVTKRPAILLPEIEIITPEERKRILDEFNHPITGNTENQLVHGLFERQAAKTPERIALIHNGQQYTYREINEKANRLAGILRQRGVGPDDPVAICLERSAWLIIAMFGVMKAGGAYLPIDHEYTGERISYLLQDSEAQLLITRENLLDLSNFRGTVIDMDEVEGEPGQWSNLPNVNTPQNLVYIIYTSGSTGNPKGVMVEHGNLLTYVKAFQNEFHLTPDDAILQQAPCSFDQFVEELYPGLLTGGTIVIADKMDVLDLKKLVALVSGNQVSLITCQPLLLKELNQAPRLEKVHTYISGADVLKPGHISNLLHRGRVYNTYGPTETTVCAAYYRCSLGEDFKNIPIGKPILDYRIYILNRDQQLAPVGIPGEICITGPGVARGYLNRPELTADKFIPNPFMCQKSNVKSPSAPRRESNEEETKTFDLRHSDFRLYRTGDLARWLPDGNLEFIGRNDEQVKIRGFRIEPGEIEYHLARHEAVAEAIVLPREGTGGIKNLAAYVKLKSEVKAQELKDYLRERLPHYMIPSLFYKIDSVPMTANSKTDKKALAECETRLEDEVQTERPLNITEIKIRNLWLNLLMVDQIGPEESFFDAGGNSILLMQLQTQLEKEFSEEIRMVDLFSQTTIAKQARWIEEKKKQVKIDTLNGALTHAPALPNKKALSQKASTEAGALGDSACLSLNGEVGPPSPVGQLVSVEPPSPVGHPRPVVQLAPVVQPALVAIIGISVKLPLAETVYDFWQNLRSGRDCVREIPAGRKKDVEDYLKFAGTSPETFKVGPGAWLEAVDGFDYSFFKISPKEASLLDPNQRLFLQTAWRAIEDAGYGGGKLKGSRTGVYLGYGSETDYLKMIREVEPESVGIAMPGNLRPVIASRLSYLLDLHGPSMIVDTTCSSSLVAVHLGCQALRNGECDLAVVGGIQLHLTPGRDFESGIASSTGRTRTFDAGADGTGTGEGAIAVILKPINLALADRDHIYAVINASSVNQDGASIGLTAPNAQAQEQVITDTWKIAGINPETITYIEAHGTGTKLGDPIEIEGIQRAFDGFTTKKQFCAVGSVKSNIGHLDNTAGIAGLVKAVLALQYRELFPSLHFAAPNRKIFFEDSPVYVNDRLAKWESTSSPRRCGVSSFGISGTNCHVALEEAPELKKDWEPEAGRPAIFTWSAKSQPALRSLIHQWVEDFKRIQEIDFYDAAYTLNTGRGHYGYRMALVVKDWPDLIELLREIEARGFKEKVSQGRYYIGFGFPDASTETQTSGNGFRELNQSINRLVKEYLEGKRRDLPTLARYYVQGADISWEDLYEGEKRWRVSLPGYSFDEKRCWLNFPTPGPESKRENLYHTIVWEEAALDLSLKTASSGNLIIFKDDRGLGEELSRRFREAGSVAFFEGAVIEVTLGERFEKISEIQFVISQDPADYGQLALELGKFEATRIIHLFSLNEDRETGAIRDLENKLHRGIYSLFYLLQAIFPNGKSGRAGRQLELVLISDNADYTMTGQKRVIPENAALFGMGKTAGWEYPNLRVRCLDIDEDTEVDSIFRELQVETGEFKVAYRNGRRLVERVHPLEFHPENLVKGALKSSGVYLITGGLGGIGLATAQLLASKNTINLAFLNRSKLPDRAQWNTLVATNQGSKWRRQIKAIEEIEQSGSKVSCFSADVTDQSQIKEVIATLKKEYGRINGIIHGAGIGEGDLLSSLTESEIRRIMAPKVEGAWLLDQLTQGEEPDFLVLFASAITLVGGVGSGPYTAANSYLDSFAWARFLNTGPGKGSKTIVIDWPAWDNTGLSEGAMIDSEKELFRVLPVSQALQALEQVLNSAATRVIIGEVNTGGKIYELGNLLPFKFAENIQRALRPTNFKEKSPGPGNEKRAVTLKGKGDLPYTEIEKRVAAAWRTVLGYEELDVNANFFEIGGDSILITRLHTLLEEEFHGMASIADLFSFPTISRLAEHLSASGSGPEEFDEQHLQKPAPDIAIIGLALRMPGADTLARFWDNIRERREFIGDFPKERRPDCEGFIRHFTSLGQNEIHYSPGGYLNAVDQFDGGFFNLSPREASLMDPNQRLFLETCWEAIEDAGYGGGRLMGSRTGVCLGYADWPVYGHYISKKSPSQRSLATAGNVPSIIASRISYLLDLKGPAFLVDTACSSSLVAVHLACHALKNGDCDLAITGGVKVCLMPVSGVFEIGIESPDGKTRAFDEDSAGTAWGEGAAALLLKPLEKALRDHDQVYAVIKSSAINQDGTSVGITAPNAQAQEAALVKAWQAAGIPPETITYIEAHGTGTRLGDPIEIDGMERAFRRYTERKQFCAVSSVKTNIGHLDSASGVAGLIKAVAALKYKEIPPTLHFCRPNRKITFEKSPVYVNDRLLKWETEGFPRRCGVSSFGFSGTNCHLVLEEAPEGSVYTGNETAVYKALLLSAKSRPGLETLLKKYREDSRIREAVLDDVCYTASTGRGHYTHRLALIVSDVSDLEQKLADLCKAELDWGHGDDSCACTRDLYYGEHQVRSHIPVTGFSEEAKPGEMSLAAKRALTEEAAALLEEIIAHGKKNKVMLRGLCSLYTRGAEVNWERFYQGETRNIIKLPGYPFQRTRYWLEPDPEFTRPKEAEAGKERPSGTEPIGEVVLKGRKDHQYTPLEKKLGNLWGQILGLNEINIYDDFFEIGGNSIFEIQMEVELERQNLRISVDDLPRHTCIRDLAASLAASPGLATGIGSATEDDLSAGALTELVAPPDIGMGEQEGVKILDRMEPFNDIFFKNCFYNSLFPIVNYFGGNVLPILLNEIIVYRLPGASAGNQVFEAGVDYESVKPLEQLLEAAGIGLETGVDHVDIIQGLERSISVEKPVIIWVDAYYESIRRDTYRKQHLDHTLLVYGYNRQAQLFSIIEHDRRENLSYRKCTLPYQDLKDAYRGFTENFAEQASGAAFCSFYRIDQNRAPGNVRFQPGSFEEVQVFAQDMLKRRDRIQTSLEALGQIVECFQTITGSETALKENIEPVVAFLNGVINAKNVDHYRLSMLLGEPDEVCEVLREITNHWSNLRKSVARFMYLPVYNRDAFAASAELMLGLWEREKGWNELLFTKLKKLS